MLTAQSLYEEIRTWLQDKGRCFLLFDEIQEVQDWPRVINSLMTDFEVDITITGSNAHLLSSELGTYIAGRYIEIPMLPLSFREYKEFNFVFRPEETGLAQDELFREYLKYGSLPVLFYHERETSFFESLLQGVYNTVVARDILQRHKLRDVVQLERVLRFALANVGQTISSRKIAATLASDQIALAHSTVVNYLQMFCDAFLLYRVPRQDVLSREVLRPLRKVTDQYPCLVLSLDRSIAQDDKGIRLGNIMDFLAGDYQLTAGFG